MLDGRPSRADAMCAPNHLTWLRNVPRESVPNLTRGRDRIERNPKSASDDVARTQPKSREPNYIGGRRSIWKCFHHSFDDRPQRSATARGHYERRPRPSCREMRSGGSSAWMVVDDDGFNIER
jgi:hypothetical protein